MTAAPMARIALIKPFTGLNLAVSQLSGELQRAGHESIIVYLKDYYVTAAENADDHLVAELPGTVVGPRGQALVWNCYERVSDQEYDLLFGLLRDFQPDLIGFSLTSSGFSLTGEVTRRVREALGVPIIWGGAGPTLQPERCLEDADLICTDEGEEVIVELARRLDAGEELIGTEGVWGWQNDEIVKTPHRSRADFENIAIPDFDPARTFHIGGGRLARDFYPSNLGRQYPIMTSRGCPFSCSFCIESVYQDMFGKTGSLRRRSVGVVIEELVQAKEKHGIEAVLFYDDVFTTHRKWLREFAPRYRNEVALPFWCYTYPTTTHREDIQLLANAGCVSMTMGIQSGSSRILREHFSRPTPLGRTREAIQIILDAGIQCFFDLITKVEFETEDDLRQTFEFLMKLPKDIRCVGFAEMVKFPGYGYTADVADAGKSHTVSDDLYRYYHRLYWLALTDLTDELKLRLADDPKFRDRPELLDEYLPAAVPFEFIPKKAMKDVAQRPKVFDVGIAQSTFLDSDAPEAEDSPKNGDRRRLPLAT